MATNTHISGQIALTYPPVVLIPAPYSAPQAGWLGVGDAWLLSPTSPTRGRPVRTYADAEAVIEGLKSILRHAHPDHTA